MSYLDGFVAAVPQANKEAYLNAINFGVNNAHAR